MSINQVVATIHTYSDIRELVMRFILRWTCSINLHFYGWHNQNIIQ